MRGWKVLTHDYRPPVQGGKPVGDGTAGAVTAKVQLDRSADECGRGWNFTRRPETALRIAGLWPDGRPSRVIRGEGQGGGGVRGGQCRAAQNGWGRGGGGGEGGA